MVREGVREKMAFEQRPEGRKGSRHANIQGKRSRQREYQVPGPGGGTCQEGLRSSTEASVSKEEMLSGKSWGPRLT